MIPHDRLLALVAGSISDGRVLALIEGYLQQEIMTDMACWQPTTGTPQGAVLSPLLANLYLHPLDLLMERSGYRMVRYADDFVILCASEPEAEAALRQITAWVTANSLTLHPDKTRIGDSQQPSQGFDFLGYRFEAGRRFVRHQSLTAFKDKVRDKTIRSRGDSLERIIADLNPLLRGWFGYFKHARPHLFRKLDGFIRRRLRAVLRKQERRPSMGGARPIIESGPMPSSRIKGSSPFRQLLKTRDIPHEGTSDWRAVCGRTASTVRRAGRVNTLPDPYRCGTAVSHLSSCSRRVHRPGAPPHFHEEGKAPLRPPRPTGR
jgi:Reverse transcriptase (RNA-dependent DNA polymerase)/Group II intron, maturase-specific domain